MNLNGSSIPTRQVVAAVVGSEERCASSTWKHLLYPGDQVPQNHYRNRNQSTKRSNSQHRWCLGLDAAGPSIVPEALRALGPDEILAATGKKSTASQTPIATPGPATSTPWLSCRPTPTHTLSSQRPLRPPSTPATGRCCSRTTAIVCSSRQLQTTVS